jgi:hypothetical protein
MKRKLGLVTGICLFVFVSQGAFAFGKKEVTRQVNMRGEQISFTELYVYHDTLRGTTQVTFFNTPKAYKKLAKSKKTSLFESYFFTDRFALVSEKVTKENKQNVYTVTLQARNNMFHKENIGALLSNILRRQVTVEDVEVAPPKTYVVGVMFNYDDYMYFPAGNSVGIYYNEYSRRILYSYDIAKAPIEFVLGYRY